jgi:hypothetical protein
VFWKRRKSSIIIPLELHEKLARTCQPIEDVDSAVICVRSIRSSAANDADDEEVSTGMSSVDRIADDTKLSDAIGYEAHWQWYR